MKHALVVSLLWTLCSCADAPPRDAATRVHRIEELTWPEIDALERAHTLVILPVGMLEQHGPHLPIGADTLAVAYEADAVAEQVSRASPDWNVLVLPPLPYGHSGANLLGDRPIHPGTYGLRQSTLRAVLADIGAQLAQNGFEWIFVLNGHGAPSHGIATDDACDFVSERFGVTMLDASALFRAAPEMQARGARMNAEFFSAEELASIGLDVHAGVAETAGMLAVRPDLVPPSYKTLPSQAGHSLEELRAVATAPGWQGYLSSPALATGEYGAAVEAWWIDGVSELILQAIGGEDLSARPGSTPTLPPAVAPVIETMLTNEAAFTAELGAWLARRQ